MIRHKIALLTSMIRDLTPDRLLVLSLNLFIGFGVLWVLYVIISASVYPSRDRGVEENEVVLEGFEFVQGITPGPRGRFVNGEGQQIGLEAFSGKVVLLNLWATWCGPCIEELPMLDNLQAEFGDRGFEVVAVSLDREGPEVAGEFLKANEINNLALYNDKTFGLARELKVSGLPVTLLIGPRGLEIGRLIGPAEWDGPIAKDLILRYIK